MDRKVSQTTKLAEENKRQIDYLVQERDSMKTKSPGKAMLSSQGC